jgi:UrcA family protein
MSTFITARAAGPRAKVALLALGGLAGIMAAGFSNAASPDSNVPRLVVQYSQSSLATAAGVSDLYRRIEISRRKAWSRSAATRPLHGR